MKRLVVLSIMVMVLGCASWAGAYTYNFSGNYGVFENDSGADAVVNLELWYGNGSGNFAYSLAGGSWVDIARGLDGESWTSGVVAFNKTFQLKFVGGTGDKDLKTYDISDPAPYWFAFNQAYTHVPGVNPTTCVAFVEGSPAVPIPGAVWLLGSGLGSLLIARRKRKA